MASSISMSRRSWCDASQPGVQLKSTSSVRKVMEVLTSELYQIHPLSQSSRRYVLAPSPCHANDAPALPLHIKGTKSRGLLFKSFTFIWHSVTRCTVSKLKVVYSLPLFFSWWDNAIYVHQQNINRKVYDPYGLKL